MQNTSKTVRTLCEGAICVAMAMVLSFFEASFWAQGGSIDLVMVPLILFAVRWGCGWGIGAGLIFGTLKYFVGAGWAIDWVSIIFDYSVAYAMVGFAGLFKRKDKQIWLAAIVGGVARFIIHYISGFTVYARYMPEEFMGLSMTSPFIYSALYNGGYMLPSTILAVVVCMTLAKPMQSFLRGDDLK